MVGGKMVKKILLSVLLILLLTSALFTACTKSTTTTPAATTKPATTTPAKWWDKLGTPKYGGTITFRTPTLDDIYFDQFLHIALFPPLWAKWLDTLAYPDWAVDRNIWSFKTMYIPLKYLRGVLLESWELTDPLTLTAKVRKGIYWQNKPPVNGREFVASDIEFNFNRMLSKPTYAASTQLQSATATDKYTIVFKFKTPGFFGLVNFLGGTDAMVAPEAVKQFGDVGNWKNSIGTGPFMLTDYVQGSSLTYAKNPNYWGYDERHPQNRLPYVDEVKVLAIPDQSTAISALRTGRIDLLAGLNWRQLDTLQKSDPQLKSSTIPLAGPSFNMRVDKSPFTDIKVRKALQMAIDRPTIAKTYYGGTVDGKPCGPANPEFKDFTIPFDKWPQELKDDYTYNPTKAKQLLAEAGYPAGFKTNILAYPAYDLDLLQIIKSEFLDIGVDMDIKTMELGAFNAYVAAMKHDQMCVQGSNAGIGITFPPKIISVWRHSKKAFANYTGNNDPILDAMIGSVDLATTEDEANKLMKDIDMYVIKQCWDITIFPLNGYIVWQPYLRGYSGEVPERLSWAGLWIDKTAP
jgi:peptide/nickel transport system substrate-binding protein